MKIFSTYRRLAKSTLILIPLFSIYYIAFSVWTPFFKIGIALELELIRLYFEIVWASFQGFVISLIYCFFNAEVRIEVIKIVERRLLKRNPNMRRLSSLSFSSARRYSTKIKERINSSQFPDNEFSVNRFNSIYEPVNPITTTNTTNDKNSNNKKMVRINLEEPDTKLQSNNTSQNSVKTKPSETELSKKKKKIMLQLETPFS